MKIDMHFSECLYLGVLVVFSLLKLGKISSKHSRFGSSTDYNLNSSRPPPVLRKLTSSTCARRKALSSLFKPERARGKKAEGLLRKNSGEGTHAPVCYLTSHDSFTEYNAVNRSIDDIDPFVNLASSDFAVDMA
jgi:hypothetical protein